MLGISLNFSDWQAKHTNRWGSFLWDTHYVSVWSLKFQRLFRKASVLLSEKLSLAQSKPDIIELLPTRVEEVVTNAVSKVAVE